MTSEDSSQGHAVPRSRGGSPWAWHARFLRALQRKLSGREAERREEALGSLKDLAVDKAEAASNEFDHEVARSLSAVEGGLLGEVDDALKRIRDGTYGLCERTGRPIPPERLRAVPWTRFCMDVERGSESAASRPGGGRTGGRRQPRAV